MLVKRWITVTAIGILLIAVSFAIIISERVEANKVFSSITILIGILFVITGVKGMVNSFIAVFLPDKDGKLVDKVYAKRILERGPRLVVVGGGHGLSTLLHGLKEYSSNITAIVTVADDGGSSGRLREEFDVLPPGDIRNCLVALADAEHLMGRLFQFRFNEGIGLKGHNFGNLFITVMSRLTGDFEDAVRAASKVLAIRGSVVPSATTKVILESLHADGSRTIGESKIPEATSPIKRVYIKPADCAPTQAALEAIRKADVIVMGPGSLYTSIMPNLLIKGIADEILKCKAKKIYVCNVMTQSGETDGYKASDHVQALINHTHRGIVNYVIVNTGLVPDKLLGKYSEEKAYPVAIDTQAIKELGCETIKGNIVNTEDYVRHDSHRLAKLIIDLVANL
ncbi:MAG: YvcK family protein [Candidatus Omnitrophica bacterium]|nr:YvcK family protein [Candidatus Omnitrophota bacterium]